MRALIVAIAFALVLSLAAPAAAVTVTPTDKTEFDAVRTLQTQSTLPVRETRRIASPVDADPTDHVHLMRMPPNWLTDLITTRENKAHAIVRIVLGRK